MRLVLFVEGLTEKRSVPQFLKRWLDARTAQPVGLTVVKFDGWPDLVKNSADKAKTYLKEPDVLAVVALLDLYGLTICPKSTTAASDRVHWARRELESRVNDARFLQFFAVHEVEAWLLSEPGIFSADVRTRISNKADHPEQVNFDEPPSALLNRVYLEKSRHRYLKITDGQYLFRRLDPNVAHQKCPYLAAMLDRLLQLSNASPRSD